MVLYPTVKTKRIYSELAKYHLANDRQTLFFSGPRLVGKTTLGEEFCDVYYNWGNQKARSVILKGEDAVAEEMQLDVARERPSVVVFDELLRYSKWKQFLKGFFDAYGKRVRIFVTGSSRLNEYKKVGDSLKGRYCPYRMHPLSVAELLRTDLPQDDIVHEPANLTDETWNNLCEFGGFPEPFCRADRLQLRRWQRLRFEQLMRGDIQNGTTIRELDQLEVMAKILASRSGEMLVYASLGAEVQVSEVTARSWVGILQSFFFGFRVSPWSRNIANSLKKTPKWYLRDWSAIEDKGKRYETILACHLLKAVEFWTDYGIGEYGLNYIRTKQKQEVDFLVTKNGSPWMLVECKSGDTKLSPVLKDFQRKLSVPYALQVVFELDYAPVDVFSSPGEAVVVGARSFLSQLV